jgi:DNA-binding MarR family transcriptional regulator
MSTLTKFGRNSQPAAGSCLLDTPAKPKITVQPDHIYREMADAYGLTPTIEKTMIVLLSFLRANHYPSILELADRRGLCERSIYAHLEKIEDAGILKKAPDDIRRDAKGRLRQSIKARLVSIPADEEHRQLRIKLAKQRRAARKARLEERKLKKAMKTKASAVAKQTFNRPAETCSAYRQQQAALFIKKYGIDLYRQSFGSDSDSHASPPQ